MKVIVCCFNKGTSSEYYRLAHAEEKTMLHYAPVWKTESGAIRWAERHGLEVVKGESPRRNDAAQPFDAPARGPCTRVRRDDSCCM